MVDLGKVKKTTVTLDFGGDPSPLVDLIHNFFPLVITIWTWNGCILDVYTALTDPLIMGWLLLLCQKTLH